MRIKGELRKISMDKSDDIKLVLNSDDDFTRLLGSFIGFENTPYEGGLYEININIPSEFPFKPPKATFKTRVWHPNISSATGYICLDLLREGKWAAAISLKNVLTSIKTLLIMAEPNDPQDAVVASQYMRDKDCFEKTAAFWNHEYANGPKKNYFEEMEGKIKILVGKGVHRDTAINDLSMADWKL